MGLYPLLDNSDTKPGFKRFSKTCLDFSSASQATANFETVNDSVLREMNERAKKQLSTKLRTSSNSFSLGEKSTPAQRSPSRMAIRPTSSSTTARKRFSVLHNSQFNRMDSIESHPKVIARNSRVDLRKEFANNDTDAASPSKRGKSNFEESPTKRIRQETKSVPVLRSYPSKTLLKPQVIPTTKPQTARDPIKPKPPRRQASRADLIVPFKSLRVTSPRGKVLNSTTGTPASAKTPFGAASSMFTDRKSRTTNAGRSVSASSAQPPSSTRKIPILHKSASTRSLKERPSDQGARAVLGDNRTPSSAVENLPSVPTRIPSYARPTQSAIRKTKSTQTLRHDPAEVKSLFAGIPRVPQSKPGSTK